MTNVTKTALGLVLLSSDKQKELQNTLRDNMVSVKQQAHDAMVQALFHASIHNDCTLMRRLLVEIVDTKAAVRRQALINSMRKHSPMELVGKEVKLTGIIKSDLERDGLIKMFPDVDASKFVVGERRPFLVDECNKNVAFDDPDNKELVKPLFQATLISPIFAATKKFNAAMENTVNGQPVDASKYFVSMKDPDKVHDAMLKIEAILNDLPADTRKELQDAMQRIKDDTALVESLGGNIGESSMEPIKAVA